MTFSCCGLVCEIGISLTTYYRRRTLDCGSQTLRRSRTAHVFGEQVVEALHLGVRDQRDGPARACAQLREGFRRARAGVPPWTRPRGGGGAGGAAADVVAKLPQIPEHGCRAERTDGQSLRNIGRLTGEHVGGQGGYSEL